LNARRRHQNWKRCDGRLGRRRSSLTACDHHQTQEQRPQAARHSV
jgi:hypothetical protein